MLVLVIQVSLDVHRDSRDSLGARPEIRGSYSLATLIGFNYGANLSLFPSYAKDLWGLKNFGMNYGVLFTAWGVRRFCLLSRLQQMLFATGKNFNSSFETAGILLLFGAALTLALKPAEPPLPTKPGAIDAVARVPSPLPKGRGLG